MAAQDGAALSAISFMGLHMLFATAQGYAGAVLLRACGAMRAQTSISHL